MSAPTTRLLHVDPQFRVADLVATAEYYRDVLGFEIGEYFGDPPVFTMVHRGRVSIQLGRTADPADLTRGPAFGYNAYVWVDDVDVLAEELTGAGADVVEGPTDRSYGCRELIVRDCNGIVLCFAKDTSPAKDG